MAAWLPAVKVVLPYLTQIVAAAIPAFKKADRNETAEAMRGQITELQDAVTHNAELIKTLATQLQQVIQDIDAASVRIENDMRTTRWLALAAIALSLVAIGLGAYSWVR